MNNFWEEQSIFVKILCIFAAKMQNFFCIVGFQKWKIRIRIRIQVNHTIGSRKNAIFHEN
jgi:hypothetical protein